MTENATDATSETETREPLATKWLAYSGHDFTDEEDRIAHGDIIFDPWGYLFDDREEGFKVWDSEMTDTDKTLEDGWFYTRLDAYTPEAAEWLNTVDDITAAELGYHNFEGEYALPDGVTQTEEEAYSSLRGPFKTKYHPDAWSVDYDDLETDENGYVIQ